MSISVGQGSVVFIIFVLLFLYWKYRPQKKEVTNVSVLSSDFAYSNEVLAKGKKILVLAPHSDDEALMCAGIIAHSLANGADVRVVVVTNGDKKGRKMALIRLKETVSAMAYLGLAAKYITFLGYGDTGKDNNSFLKRLYHAATDTTLVASNVGTETYGLPEIPDYHYQKCGVHARYDRATFRHDLESVIEDFYPDHIFVSSLYETHPDHVMLNRFTVEAIINVKRHSPNFTPVMHEYLVHAYEGEDGDDYWPIRDGNRSPLAHFSKPDPLEANTLLEWGKREIFIVPLAMQRVPRSKNQKYIAIGKYRSQKPARNNRYLYSYVKRDEFFWKKDFANIAFLASVNVSSENMSTNQLGIKAIDGFRDGSTRFPGNEWVTMGETAGAWIRLSWTQAHIVNKIILYSRPGQSNIISATLDFSDGSSLQVGTLSEKGYGYKIDFEPKKIEWVKMTIDIAEGENSGLSEFEVYELNAMV